MRLEWTDTDATTDGRFEIVSEQIRGEPRYYSLICRRTADRKTADTIVYRGREYDGSFDKRAVKRWAQRIADAVDAAAAPLTEGETQ